MVGPRVNSLRFLQIWRILKNCFDDPKEIANVIAERTHSEVVRVIGKKIVLYRAAKKPKLTLPQ